MRRFDEVKRKPEDGLLNVIVLLFYISMINSFRLLLVTGFLAILHYSFNRKNRPLMTVIGPVLPFSLLMLIPMAIGFLTRGALENFDFTMMILGKVIISSVVIGITVSREKGSSLVEGLISIGFPPLINRILALTFRYFQMVHYDVKVGRKALTARGIDNRRGLGLLATIGEWIGGFFLKSSHHGEMVFNAMKSRGFEGDSKPDSSGDKRRFAESGVLTLFLLLVLLVDWRY